MTRRAVLYARTSYDDRGTNGRNLIGQLEVCRDCAQEKGWDIAERVAEDDRGASGAALELPGLNRVWDIDQAGEFDVMVPRELDRLSRSLAKQLLVEDELKRYGVDVDYASGDYADTPEGQLMKNVRAVIAEYERLEINERTAGGRRMKARAGNVMVYGSPLYGYRLAEMDGKRMLVVHEREAKIVVLIFTWYTDGDAEGRPMNLSDFTRRITAMRIPTHADTAPIKRGAKKQRDGVWHRGAVHRMLGNETSAGVWRYKKMPRCDNGRRRSKTAEEEQLTTKVPAIVSCEM